MAVDSTIIVNKYDWKYVQYLYLDSIFFIVFRANKALSADEKFNKERKLERHIPFVYCID